MSEKTNLKSNHKRKDLTMNGLFLFQKFMPLSKHCLEIYSPCCQCYINPSQHMKRKKSKLSLRLTCEACGVLAVSLAMAHIF